MIYLVRQGETDWNLNKRFNGSTDVELNQTGIAQAKRQGENLKGVKFDACFCSPKKRTRQTCEQIHQGPTVLDERLAEIVCGEFEGAKETAEAFQLFWQAIKTGARGTESFQNFTERTYDFCGMVERDHRGQNVLVVTHSVNARFINYHFLGKPKDYDIWQSVILNGGLLTYENY